MASEYKQVLRYYKGPQLFFPTTTDDNIDAVKKFQHRDDDILIATYAKCGTHWMNEVVQLMVHDGDPTQLDSRHRRAVFEIIDATDFSNFDEIKAGVEVAETDPSPRVLSTHLQSSYLSEEIWEKRIPIVYVLRDPRDVALSFYEFMKHFQLREGEPYLQGKNFEQYLQDYIEGKVPYGGWCEHALSYEEKWRSGENILFTSYEEMKQDLPKVINAIAGHIKYPVSDEVVRKVVAGSTLDVMQKNYAKTTKSKDGETSDSSKFFKAGVSGKWKKEHSGDQWKDLNQLFGKKVKGTQFAKRYFD